MDTDPASSDSRPHKVVFPATNPDDPTGPPILRTFDSYIDERYPPGSAARAEFDAYGDRMQRQNAVVDRLTNWMFRLPLPRWDYAEPEVIEGELHRFRHGVGHIMGCFWADMAKGLLFERHGRSVGEWLASTFYLTLDGLAFHYFDDAYVPWPREVGSGRRAVVRRRRDAAIGRSVDTMDELKAAGLLDDERPAGG